ncbi:MAG: hypothetical protein ACP5IG_02615 [Candidatus Micrarchaeia archaeon]|jgi:hypothetical protein
MVEPFLYGSFLQLVVGVILFAAAGFLSFKALFGESRGIEAILFSVVLGALLPSLLVFFLNFFLGLKMDFFAVAACFVLVAVASWVASTKSRAQYKQV